MITFAVASPAAINTGIWFRSHRGSFPSGFSSASRKFFPLTANLYPIEKEIVRSFRAFEFHNLGRVSVQPVFSKVESNSEVDVRTLDLKNSDSLASTFEDISFSLPRASSFVAKTSRKEKNPNRLSCNAARINIPDDILPVIRYPLGTESAIKAMLEHNTLVFVVDKHADKKNIKDSAEKMFKIRAKKVNTVITPDGTKKAYVMLASDCNALDVAKRIKIL
ncbi:hypothetical protein DH2020_048864 [Rehmannia glutinosa]|uniref:Uncharacterized protein n=1 Tax=Rehmannia glutinosa TaxID=99300 RepID=A0ABR0U4N7_REHGL